MTNDQYQMTNYLWPNDLRDCTLMTSSLIPNDQISSEFSLALDSKDFIVVYNKIKMITPGWVCLEFNNCMRTWCCVEIQGSIWGNVNQIECYYAELQSCFSLILAQVEWRALHNLIIKVAVITINNETRKIVLVSISTNPGLADWYWEEMSSSSALSHHILTNCITWQFRDRM